MAAINGQLECCKILAQRGSDVNALSGLIDKSPLHFAAELGHLSCVKMLLKWRANVNLIGCQVCVTHKPNFYICTVILPYIISPLDEWCYCITYKGMYKTVVRFKNNVEAKLLRGNLQII